MYVYALLLCQGLWRLEENVGSSGPGVTSGCEPPLVALKNRVLWKSRFWAISLVPAEMVFKMLET